MPKIITNLDETLLTVKLYTKSGCHLCDDVVVLLQQLAAQYPHHLQQVDITRDAALFTRYRYTIPVVQIGDALLMAPISALDLEAALATAVATPEQKYH